MKLPAYLSSEAHSLLKAVNKLFLTCYFFDRHYNKVKWFDLLIDQLLYMCVQLLQKDPSKRLGNGAMGSDEIKRHKWFKPINWKKLENREIQPSFRPEVAGDHCVANFDKCWTDMPLTESPASSPNGSTTLFQRFTYVKPAVSFLESQSSVIHYTDVRQNLVYHEIKPI